MSQDKSVGEGVTGTRGNDPAGTGMHTGPRLIERKTVLRGCSIDPPRAHKSVLRKRTEDELREKNPEIPYHAAEKASRDLFCSILERQDRMNEAIFQRVIDLQYRVDDLELDFAEHRGITDDNDAEVQR